MKPQPEPELPRSSPTPETPRPAPPHSLRTGAPEFAVGRQPETRFRFAFDPVEAEYPFTRWLEAFYRFDGMRRVGNVAATSPLSDDTGILRQTFGVNFVVERGLRIKASGELWDLTDFDDEVAVHAGVTANF